MKNNKVYVEQVRHPLVDNYIKTIRSLAGFGRNYYQKFLIQPLTAWYSDNFISEELDEIMNKIKNAEKDKRYNKLPGLYRTALAKSVAEDQFNLSLPGNISLDFLKLMKDDANAASSDEALEFVNLLYKPLKDFNDIQFRKMNKKFQQEIASADDEEVVNLAEIRKSAALNTKKEKKYAEKRLHEIKAVVDEIGIKELKRLILPYLLHVATPKDPTLHRMIFPLMKELEITNKGFFKDIMDSLAVLIYHEVVKAIRAGDLKRTFILISKYTVLFRGNPATPNYKEIDSFERNFFDLIEKRNLWSDI